MYLLVAALLVAACAPGDTGQRRGPRACGRDDHRRSTFAQQLDDPDNVTYHAPESGLNVLANMTGVRVAPTHLGDTFGWTAVPVTPSGQAAASVLFDYEEGAQGGLAEIAADPAGDCPLDVVVYRVDAGGSASLVDARADAFVARGSSGVAVWRALGAGSVELLGALDPPLAWDALLDTRVLATTSVDASVLASARTRAGGGILAMTRCGEGACSGVASLDLPAGAIPLAGLAVVHDDASSGLALLPVDTDDATTVLVASWSEAGGGERLAWVSRQEWALAEPPLFAGCDFPPGSASPGVLALRPAEDDGLSVCRIDRDSLLRDGAEAARCDLSGLNHDQSGLELGDPGLSLGCGDIDGDGASDAIFAGHTEWSFEPYRATVLGSWPDDPVTGTPPSFWLRYPLSGWDWPDVPIPDPLEFTVGTRTFFAPVFQPDRVDLVITTPTEQPDGTPPSIAIFPWDIPGE